MIDRILEYLPRGNTLEDHAWCNRHRIVLSVLAIHLPVLLGFGLFLRSELGLLAQALSVPLLCLVAGYLIQNRRPASIVATAGLTWCSAALVVITDGSSEARFHFFIIIGFIALYQDWVPFLWNIVFTVVSHGVGSAVPSIQMFNHPSGQTSPWVWAAVHGAGVLAACIGLVIFWRVSEDDQQARARLAHRLAEAEIGRRRFTSELLTNLARRNESMLYRQLEIINQIEEKERDPDALAELFTLDHLATRVRRNAESLMVLAGETPARVWSAPVPLREVLQAAIAETEDLDRVRFTVDGRLAVAGHTITDLTHLLAELIENAVRFSPPQTRVTISGRPLPRRGGAHLLTIEDWGLGMRPEVIQETNRLLSHPPEVDLSVSQRLGFHVVARLAQRHGIEVSLTPTPGTGVTAVVVLPPELFASTGNGVPVATNGVPASTDGARAEAPDGAPVRPAPNGTPVQVARDGDRCAGNGAAARPSPRPTARRPAAALPPIDPGEATVAHVGFGAGETQVVWSSANGSWDGWWDDASGSAGAEPVGAVLPADDLAEPSSGQPSPAAGGTHRLNRRRPQTHLAPELLSPTSRPEVAPPRVPDPRPASDALSRYQANRQAAQAEAGQHGLSENGDAG